MMQTAEVKGLHMKKLIFALLLIPVVVQAEAPPPPMPAKAVLTKRVVGDKYPQQVTVRRQHGQTIEEYRIKGQLTMVKITPSKNSPPYYIYYNEEWSGSSARHDLDAEKTHYWKLFTW